MTERADYTAVAEADVERLRASLDHGDEWTKAAAMKAWGWNERRFRAAVSELRRRAYPVISMSEAYSTYRRARSVEELERFIDQELVTRTRELEQRIRVLREYANRWRADGTQQRLMAI